MTDYEKMYLSLFNEITDAVQSITDVQCIDEENFLKLFEVKQALMSAQVKAENMFVKTSADSF